MKIIQLRPEPTSSIQVDITTSMIKGYLKNNSDVQVTVILEGPQASHPHIAMSLIEQIYQGIEDVGIMVGPPQIVKRNVIVIFTKSKGTSHQFAVVS